jgi:hypothetical protein
MFVNEAGDVHRPDQSSERAMANTVAASRSLRAGGDSLLNWSGRIWFSVALVGQLAFVAYIALFFGAAAVRGDLAAWNEALVGGFGGAPARDAALASHFVIAGLITLAGLLQLAPSVRKRAPLIHRWTGRGYLALALFASIGGFFALWTRETPGSLAISLGLSLNGVLILLAGSLAWREALARRFGAHRRWALRLFLLVSGVWFFRLGLVLWAIASGGPSPDLFEGPFARVWAFGCYLVPLAIAELYLRAEAWSAGAQKGVAAVVLLCALLTAVGVAGAVAFMWAPRI